MSTVKIKILRAIGSYQPGQEVEVSQELADQLTREVSHHNGTEIIKYRNAVTMKQHEDMQKAAKEVKSLSQGQAAELGVKNVVPTPKDEKFEKELQKASETKPDEPSPMTPPAQVQAKSKNKGKASADSKSQAQ